MSSGRGMGGGHTDGVEDEHDSEVVDDCVVELLRDASLRAHGSARGGHTCGNSLRHLSPSRVRSKEYPMPRAEPIYPKTPKWMAHLFTMESLFQTGAEI